MSVAKVCVDCLMISQGLADELSISREDTERVATALEGWTISMDEDVEGYFGWLPCDICKSPLGGDRFTVIAEYEGGN
jgi:hypothetical protein